MGKDQCFRVGHKLSYSTGSSVGESDTPSWKGCLVMYEDDDCLCVKDYQYVDIQKGADGWCHELATDPYHGSYHWHEIDPKYVRGLLF